MKSTKFYGYDTNGHHVATFAIEGRPRAMAPAGATYPRAVVLPLESGRWGIGIRTDAVNASKPLLNEDGEVRSFGRQRWAIKHAAREIAGMRARRHPAGMSWLKGISGINP